jgi:hypothetical protein
LYGFLKLVRDADHARVLPASTMPEESKATIVKTAAYSDSIAVLVERDERRQNHVHLAWVQ